MKMKGLSVNFIEARGSAGIDFFPSAPVTKNGKTVCEIKYFLMHRFLKKIGSFFKKEHSYLILGLHARKVDLSPTNRERVKV